MSAKDYSWDIYPLSNRSVYFFRIFPAFSGLLINMIARVQRISWVINKTYSIYGTLIAISYSYLLLSLSGNLWLGFTVASAIKANITKPAPFPLNMNPVTSPLLFG